MVKFLYMDFGRILVSLGGYTIYVKFVPFVVEKIIVFYYNICWNGTIKQIVL